MMRTKGFSVGISLGLLVNEISQRDRFREILGGSFRTVFIVNMLVDAIEKFGTADNFLSVDASKVSLQHANNEIVIQIRLYAAF